MEIRDGRNKIEFQRFIFLSRKVCKSITALNLKQNQKIKQTILRSCTLGAATSFMKMINDTVDRGKTTYIRLMNRSYFSFNAFNKIEK